MPDSINSFSIPKTESLNVQLSELNARSRWYAGRLWQLPFAYLAIVAIGLTGLDPEEDLQLSRVLAGMLVVLGFMVIWCMRGTSKGMHRAVQKIAGIEADLGLQISVRTHPIGIELPYSLMVLSGIAVCLYVLISSCPRG